MVLTKLVDSLSVSVVNLNNNLATLKLQRQIYTTLVDGTRYQLEEIDDGVTLAQSHWNTFSLKALCIRQACAP